MRKTRAENDVECITRDSRDFLLARVRGERPVVPDSVWHGADCWVIETGAYGWKISERGREAMAVLSAQARAIEGAEHVGR